MIKFKSLQKVNPRDLAAPKKHYATAVSSGVIDFEELSEFVSDQSTMSEADCYGVLKALERTIIREMRKGKSIRLGDIGTFQVNLRSEGKDTSEEVTASAIKSARTIFRPGKRFKRMLKTLEFSKIQDQVA